MSRPAPSRVQAAEGFADLVAARRGPMLTMARALVRHDADAEDLVHDVLASALLRWRRVSAADDPAAYVNRMLVNAALSWWRRPARRERPADRDALDAALERTGGGAGVGGRADLGSDPGAHAGEREAVLAALRALPVRHRAVLVLRYLEGVPDAEIAEALRMAPSTVRSCARRGLAALRAAGLRDDVERVG